MTVGRTAELDRLRSAVRAAAGAGRNGGPGCLLLVGEGGVGKTRLLGEAAALGRELGVEAHEKPDGPGISAMFFVGFLGLLIVEEMLG